MSESADSKSKKVEPWLRSLARFHLLDQHKETLPPETKALVESKAADGAKMLDKLDEEIKTTPGAEAKLHPDVKRMLAGR